ALLVVTPCLELGPVRYVETQARRDDKLVRGGGVNEAAGIFVSQDEAPIDPLRIAERRADIDLAAVEGEIAAFDTGSTLEFIQGFFEHRVDGRAEVVLAVDDGVGAADYLDTIDCRVVGRECRAGKPGNSTNG